MAANLTQMVEDLKYKAKSEMSRTNKDHVKYVQTVFLARGASGFKGLQRRFRLMDKDGNRTLSFDEFSIGMKEAGVHLMSESMLDLFQQFDRDGEGLIDYDEFIYTVQPKMNGCRTQIVEKVFRSLDKTGDKQITIKDLLEDYFVEKHPKFMSGEWTREKILKDFLKTFEAEEHADGTVTLQEFMSYYSCISCNIDKDSYFQLMMKSTWRKFFQDG